MNNSNRKLADEKDYVLNYEEYAGGRMLREIKNLTNTPILIGKLVIPEGVTTILSALSGRIKGIDNSIFIHEIVLPSTIETICEYAFECYGIKKLTIKNIEDVESLTISTKRR